MELIAAYISSLENDGKIDKNCKTCKEVFYPELLKGKNFYNIFAPRHKASNRCESGKYPHCSCDVCF